MTKKLLFSLAAFLLFVSVSPALFAQVAPAAPVAPVAPAQSLSTSPLYMPAAPPAPPAHSAVVAPPAPQEPVQPSPPGQPVQGAAPLAFGFNGDNFLGVSVEEVTRENMSRYGLTGEPRGLVVTRVVKDSPAERAGLRQNDVILSYDGEAVGSYRKLNRLIDESSPEHNARLTIRRGGGEQEINVTLGKRQGFAQLYGGGVEVWRGEELRQRAEELNRRGAELDRRGAEARRRGGEAQQRGDEARRRAEDLLRNNPGGFQVLFGGNRRIGVSTTALSEQLADYFGISGRRGVLVSSVEQNSPADKAGLKAGDVITEADGQRIEEAGDLSRVINGKSEGEITLNVIRDKKQRTIKVTPEQRQSPVFTTPNVLLTSPVATVALPRISMTLPSVTVTTPRVTVTPLVKPVRLRRPVTMQPVL